MTLALVFYTLRFIPEKYAGVTLAFLVLIRPSYREDAGLLAHEKTHVRQFWRTFGINMLRYYFSADYRLQAELEAYRMQLTYAPRE